MSVGVRIRELLDQLGMSGAELARRIGVTQPTISDLINGRSRSSVHLHAIARELGTTPEYLLGETDEPGIRLGDKRLPWRGPEPDPRRDPDLVEVDQIDLRYGLGATYVDVPIDAQKRVFSRSWLRNFTASAPEHLFWTAGEGDSMDPTIRSGEIVLIDTAQKIPRMSGGIWAITIGEVGMIKRHHVPGKGRVQFLSDNGREPPIEPTDDDELVVIGRVVAVVRRL